MTILSKDVKSSKEDAVLIIEGAFELTEDDVLIMANHSGIFIGPAFHSAVSTALVGQLSLDRTVPINHEVKACVVSHEPFTAFQKWTYSVVSTSRLM